MIIAERLSKTYGRHESKVVALRSVDLKVERSERVALLGRSGSGKTTLVNLLAGLDRPSTGRLEIDGQGLQSLSADELARYRRDKLGVVFQSFQLIPNCNAIQNVALPMTLSGITRKQRRRRAIEVLEQVGLADRAKHRPSQLSGGEQQRVAIARAIVNEPAVLLADEPTGNLDSKTAQEIEELLTQICDDTQATLVLITHDEQLSTRMANRTLRLQDGQLSETLNEAVS